MQAAEYSGPGGRSAQAQILRKEQEARVVRLYGDANVRTLRREVVRPASIVSSSTPEMVTCLVAEFAGQAEDAAVIIANAGSLDAGWATMPDGGRAVTGMFGSVTDAMRAAAALADLRRRHVDARMALCTGFARSSGPSPRSALTVRAVRLLAHALPGEILTTASTAVMAGQTPVPGTEIFDRGSRTLEPGGILERVYELRVAGTQGAERDTPPPSNLDWARRALSGPVAGIDTHLSALEDSWRSASSGEGRFVVLTGDGPLTTATAAELALRLHATGALVLYGRWDDGAATPYQAFREALGVHADGCSKERLRQDLEGRGGALAPILPDLGARIGAPQPARSSYGDPNRVLQAVEGWLHAIASRTPTLLVLDGLHAADPASVLLLEHLWHCQSTVPLLVVVTGSESAERPCPLEWLDDLGDQMHRVAVGS